jgi:hypothetical protein
MLMKVVDVTWHSGYRQWLLCKRPGFEPRIVNNFSETTSLLILTSDYEWVHVKIFVRCQIFCCNYLISDSQL